MESNKSLPSGQNSPANHVVPNPQKRDSARRNISREESDLAFARLVKMQDEGTMGDSEVLEKPVKAIDGKWYTAEEFIERYGR